MFKEHLKRVEAFVFDVDGVLSNQVMSIAADGRIIRTSCSKDGYAIMYCIKKGFPICVISGGEGPGLRERLERLGIKEIYLGIPNKMEALKEFIEKYEITPENIMYMGDDVPDYNVMKMVGMPVCPADACEEIKSISKYISDINGGFGCVRDVIAQVLKAKGVWMDLSCYVKSI